MSYSNFTRGELTRLHDRGTKGRVISLVPRMIHLAVEQFHADGDALLFRERRNLGESGDAVGDRRRIIDSRNAIAEHGDDIGHPRLRGERQRRFQFIQQQRVVGRIVEAGCDELIAPAGISHGDDHPGIVRHRPLILEQQIDARQNPICLPRRQKSASGVAA